MEYFSLTSKDVDLTIDEILKYGNIIVSNKSTLKSLEPKVDVYSAVDKYGKLGIIGRIEYLRDPNIYKLRAESLLLNTSNKTLTIRFEVTTSTNNEFTFPAYRECLKLFVENDIRSNLNNSINSLIYKEVLKLQCEL